jgi:hypothetical protein
MAAFVQPGFTVAVIVDGKPIRESNEENIRTVRVPFDTEYKLRLKNKTDRRALIDVLIDGTSVLMSGQQFLLAANSQLDIERFVLDGNLRSGKKFKFVRDNHVDVDQPGDPQNGRIEVRFHQEDQWTTIIDSLRSYPGYPGYPGYSGIISIGSTSMSQTSGTNLNITNQIPAANLFVQGGTVGTFTSNCANISELSTSHLSSSVASVSSDKGATVHGGTSEQKFQSSTENFKTFAPVSIQIQLKGPKPLLKKPEDKPWAIDMNRQLIRFNGTLLGQVEQIGMDQEYVTLKVKRGMVDFKPL